MNLNNFPQQWLFNQLLENIEKHLGKLPDTGIVAGQAVASACFELLELTTEPLPYNDIDVFVDQVMLDEKYNNGKRPPHQNRLSRKTKPVSPQLKLSSFQGIEQFRFFDDNEKDSYYIVSSTRDEINPNINIIGVYMDSAFREDPRFNDSDEIYGPIIPPLYGKGDLIIHGFDINACEIGLDLDKQCVVWSEAFQSFLFRHQLKTTFLGTPMHSAVRLCKKCRDLPWATCDFPAEMRKLQSVREIFRRLEKNRAQFQAQPNRDFISGNLFSDVYAERFEHYREQLADYFSLEEKRCLFSKFDDNEKDHVWFEKTMYTLAPSDYDTFAVDSFWTLMQDKKGRVVTSAEYLAVSFADWYPAAQAKKKRGGIEKLLSNKNFKKAGPSITRWFLSSIINDNFNSARQLAPVHIKRMLKVFERHPLLLEKFSYYGLSLNAMSHIARQVKFLEKNGLRFYIGWFEQHPLNPDDPTLLHSSCKSMSPYCVSMHAPDFRQRIKHALKDYLDTQKDVRFTPRTTNILKSIMAERPGLILKELSSSYDFIVEGNEMRHCVGGYYNSSENDELLVFSLTDRKQQRSTLALSLSAAFIQDEDGTKNEIKCDVFIHQHFGPANEPCPDSHLTIAMVLKEKLKKQYLALYQEAGAVHGDDLTTLDEPDVVPRYDNFVEDEIPF